MSSTEKNISLRHIIKTVVEEYGVYKNGDEESLIRDMQRKFNKLITKLGCDVNVLKRNGKNFNFKEEEIPTIKVILSQIIHNEGIISDFVNDRDDDYSIEKIHAMIQELINEAEKAGMGENDLKYTAAFLCNVFSLSPQRSIKYCHRLIDMLAYNLQDLTSTQQAFYLNEVECLLRKEFFLRIAESTVNIKDIAEILEFSKELSEDDIGYQNYSDQEYSIIYEYTKRDREMLKKIQEDDALRQYIETTIGKKAEDIFNFANETLII